MPTPPHLLAGCPALNAEAWGAPSLSPGLASTCQSVSLPIQRDVGTQRRHAAGPGTCLGWAWGQEYLGPSGAGGRDRRESGRFASSEPGPLVPSVLAQAPGTRYQNYWRDEGRREGMNRQTLRARGPARMLARGWLRGRRLFGPGSAHLAWDPRGSGGWCNRVPQTRRLKTLEMSSPVVLEARSPGPGVSRAALPAEALGTTPCGPPLAPRPAGPLGLRPRRPHLSLRPHGAFSVSLCVSPIRTRARKPSLTVPSPSGTWEASSLTFRLCPAASEVWLCPGDAQCLFLSPMCARGHRPSAGAQQLCTRDQEQGTQAEGPFPVASGPGQGTTPRASPVASPSPCPRSHTHRHLRGNLAVTISQGLCDSPGYTQNREGGSPALCLSSEGPGRQNAFGQGSRPGSADQRMRVRAGAGGTRPKWQLVPRVAR